MILLDANVLLYSYLTHCEQHEETRAWLEAMLDSGNEIVGVSWQVITAFLRIGTNPRIFEIPFPIDEAITKLDNLLAHTMVAVVGPTERHWKVYSSLLAKKNIKADLVMDAQLAALAIEHNARIATTDSDFAIFPEVKTINPLEAQKRK